MNQFNKSCEGEITFGGDFNNVLEPEINRSVARTSLPLLIHLSM